MATLGWDGLHSVVFDFDYTLVDSSRAFLDCHRFAAASLGLPEQAPEAILKTIGTALPLAVRTLIGPEEPEARLSQYVQVYQARAEARMTDLTVVYDGVPAMLAALRDAGLRLAIVSQKPRHRIEAVLRRDGIAGRFDAVIGGDDVTALKPEPDGILYAIGRLESAPEASLYVGDTAIDAAAAARGGLPFVAVLSGKTRREEFDGHTVRDFLEGVAELPRLLATASTRP
jgi:phosphoglycolate phosphatase